MKHTTSIDTVKIQVDLTSQAEQQVFVNAIQDELRATQEQIHIKIKERRVRDILISLEYCLYVKRKSAIF